MKSNTIRVCRRSLLGGLLGGLVAVPPLSATQVTDTAGQETAFVQKTFTYKVIDGITIEAEVYRADDEVTRPVLVWIHGGALIFRDRFEDLPTRVLDLCRIAGFVLVSIDYRLAPEVKLPAIIEDLEDAFRWIRREGPSLFHADPHTLVVAGRSAGGYLTMMSGIAIQPRPTALLAESGYGAIDSEWYTGPSDRHGSGISREEAYERVGDSVLTSGVGRGRSRFYVYLRQNGLWTKEVTGFDPDTEQDELHRYDPVRNITGEYPPILMIHGTDDHDVPFAESVGMAEELARHNVRHELILVPEGGHHFGGADPVAVTKARNRGLAFIHGHLLGEARAQEIEPFLAARLTLETGAVLASQGNITEALDAYEQVHVLEPRISVTAYYWYTLCWNGSLWGHAAEVMAACEQAVALEPDIRGNRNARGLARALTGDVAGAIDDFQAFTGNDRNHALFQGWIDALRAGRNPFTPELLERLRN